MPHFHPDPMHSTVKRDQTSQVPNYRNSSDCFEMSTQSLWEETDRRRKKPPRSWGDWICTRRDWFCSCHNEAADMTEVVAQQTDGGGSAREGERHRGTGREGCKKNSRCWRWKSSQAFTVGLRLTQTHTHRCRNNIYSLDFFYLTNTLLFLASIRCF